VDHESPVSRGGAVVKLGGALLTDKTSPRLEVRKDVLTRLASEIFEAAPRPLVIVHGAGCFGHEIVKRTGIHRGLDVGGDRDAALLAWAETGRLQYELDVIVAGALVDAGIPAVPVQASATAILRGGVLESMDIAALDLTMAQGAVPLLYGVPAVDREQGCAILSGDAIAPYLAEHLGLDLIVLATNVDGVFEADPSQVAGASPIARIDETNWDEVRARLGGSAGTDVTGGMLGKVEKLVGIARGGATIRIVNGTVPGRVASALRGEPVGTLVAWSAR